MHQNATEPQATDYHTKGIQTYTTQELWVRPS